jgi:hypothetical protein
MVAHSGETKRTIDPHLAEQIKRWVSEALAIEEDPPLIGTEMPLKRIRWSPDQNNDHSSSTRVSNTQGEISSATYRDSVDELIASLPFQPKRVHSTALDDNEKGVSR